MKHVKVAVIGAGSAGLTALGLLRKDIDDYVLINKGAYGTTCARVGCMPSKVLIQIADDYSRLKKLAVQGIQGAEQVTLDGQAVMARVRALRDGFVEKTIAPWQGLPAEKNINAAAQFVGKNELELTFDNGHRERIRADNIIVAPGSRPVLPAAWQALGDRVLTSDQFFELEALPKRVAVIGLGIIGLELGQALARLGVDVVGVEMADTIGGIVDPEVRTKAIELIGHDFPLYLQQAAELEKTDHGVLVKLGATEIEVDVVLATMGRRPNLDTLSLEQAGIELDQRGMPIIDPETLRVPNTDIYIAGDATGQKAILHEAADEGRIAAYNVLSQLSGHSDQHYGSRSPLGMAFTHPNIGFFGQRFDELNPENTVVGTYDFAMLGRPRVMQEYQGLLRLYADKDSKRLLGGEMIGPRGEHLLHQLAWVHQLQVEVADILRLPFYHPNLEEGVRHALRDLAKQLYGTAPKEVVLR